MAYYYKQDFHCNANILKQELMRKRQLALMGSTNIMLPQPPAHPGYAQNAAMLAIRRHATNYVVSFIAGPIALYIEPNQFGLPPHTGIRHCSFHNTNQSTYS